MGKIVVRPEELERLAARMQETSAELRRLRDRATGALRSLDLDSSVRPVVEGHVQAVVSRSNGLAEVLEGMARYGRKKAAAFAEADRQGGGSGPRIVTASGEAPVCYSLYPDSVLMSGPIGQAERIMAAGDLLTEEKPRVTFWQGFWGGMQFVGGGLQILGAAPIGAALAVTVTAALMTIGAPVAIVGGVAAVVGYGVASLLMLHGAGSMTQGVKEMTGTKRLDFAPDGNVGKWVYKQVGADKAYDTVDTVMGVSQIGYGSVQAVKAVRTLRSTVSAGEKAIHEAATHNWKPAGRFRVSPGPGSAGQAARDGQKEAVRVAQKTAGKQIRKAQWELIESAGGTGVDVANTGKATYDQEGSTPDQAPSAYDKFREWLDKQGTSATPPSPAAP